MAAHADRSLAELVLERPSAARVLTRLGLDYCCGGRQSLAQACRERQLDPATVVVFLEREDDPVALEATDWAVAPLDRLCAHIVEEHHARLRWELPRLGELAERAAEAHGGERPALHDLRDELAALRAGLEPHLDDEEESLFPAIAAGDAVDAARLEPLLRGHDEVGERLRRLRELAGGYGTGGALCNTHRGLLQGLHGLELELHQHVHEENNVLFPRAQAASARRRNRSGRGSWPSSQSAASATRGRASTPSTIR
jgi:regulator of cell morphogenesis and NO signaling